LLALEELHQAGEWMERRALGESAVGWQRHTLERMLGSDRALGDRILRSELTTVLRSPLREMSDSRRRLRELIDRIRPGYVDRWARLAAEEDPPGPERLARAVAAHLLDRGYSPFYLRNWLRDHPSASAAELTEAAATLAAAPKREFEVVVPVLRVPHMDQLQGRIHWLTAAAVAEWFSRHAIDSPLPAEVVGAFRYRILAYDAEAAAEISALLLERLTARVSFAPANDALRLLGSAFVAAYGKASSFSGGRQPAVIPSLVAEEQLHVVGVGRVDPETAQSERLDDALELAGAINGRAVAPAITGGWAGLESLLTEPADSDDHGEGRVLAAARAADLIACSWPRAEMTALAHQVRDDRHDDLSQRIASCSTNVARARLVADRIGSGGNLLLPPGWRHGSDLAAVARMRVVINNPAQAILDARLPIEVTMRRLYRCRNIIVHGGRAGGVLNAATLRVAAPLVGAALDRLAHAHLTTQTPSLVLAARAAVALQLAGSELGAQPTDLLL
jgi:hypothetical protein